MNKIFRWIVFSGVTLTMIPLTMMASGCGVPASTPDETNMNNMTNPGTPVSFNNDIIPIFQINCQGCHDPGGSSGIVMNLTNNPDPAFWINQPSVQVSAFTLIVPGDATLSLIYLKVSSNTPPVGTRMPLAAPPMSDTEIQLLRDWIDQGALNN